MSISPGLKRAAFEPTGDEIVFIGSRIFFPDIMLRLIGNEIDGLHPRRIAPGSGLDDAEFGDARLVLFEESFLPGVIERERVWRERGLEAIFVLAYRDACTARALLHGATDFGPVAWLRFLPSGLPADTLVAMLRILMAGDMLIPAELMAPPAPPSVAEVCTTLTARETEVLALVARGWRNKSIANEINVSEHTVKLHIHNLIRKLGVANRTEAATWFLSRPERRT